MDASKMVDGSSRRLLFVGLMCAIFVKMFVLSWHIPWAEKYQLFSVPAFSYPGADARNIQMTAHCTRKGYPFFGKNECVEGGSLIKELYPEAWVPPYNYPSIWSRVYSLFGDDSERFFRLFWRINAVVLLVAYCILSWRYNVKLLPLLLFNPVTLLVVERGNIEAITFFFTFIPLLVFSISQSLQSLSLAFASSLKIFPIFGLIAFSQPKFPFLKKEALRGLFFMSPLLTFSFIEIPWILSGTSKGFFASYGIMSLQFLAQLNGFAMVVAAVYGVVWICSLTLMLRNSRMELLVKHELMQLRPIDLTILLVSAAIFVGTFASFSNWAYRLIFLIPSALILSQSNLVLNKIIVLNIFFVFWIPLAPHGWSLLNLACFPLAISLSYILWQACRIQNSPYKGS